MRGMLVVHVVQVLCLAAGDVLWMIVVAWDVRNWWSM